MEKKNYQQYQQQLEGMPYVEEKHIWATHVHNHCQVGSWTFVSCLCLKKHRMVTETLHSHPSNKRFNLVFMKHGGYGNGPCLHKSTQLLLSHIPSYWRSPQCKKPHGGGRGVSLSPLPAAASWSSAQRSAGLPQDCWRGNHPLSTAISMTKDQTLGFIPSLPDFYSGKGESPCKEGLKYSLAFMELGGSWRALLGAFVVNTSEE